MSSPRVRRARVRRARVLFACPRRLLLLVPLLLVVPVAGQELPLSGTYGFSYVWASDPAGGSSQLYQIDPTLSTAPVPVAATVASVPSRWAHRRRTLGATETAIAYAPPLELLTPMGDAAGNGAIHLVDYRTGSPPSSALIPTGNPAGYDLLVAGPFARVFAAEDGGAGDTILRGFSYATPGTLTPLSPPTLALPGSPAAYVNRMALDGKRLYVPTSEGLAVVKLASNAPQMALEAFHSTVPAAPTTNPAHFDRNGVETWIVGTTTFGAGGDPDAAGWFAWDVSGATEADVFGQVFTDPTKQWVPAVGSEELAVVGDGTDSYVYELLREPGPGTFFVKGGAVGVVGFTGSAPAVTDTLPCSDTCGEPFGIPAASGTRVAFETSFGPPFVNMPIDGGERVAVLYSPLDPLGANTSKGLLGVPAPLGGRISTKGVDRPIWSDDGTRVFAATGWFPGAPNPALPGLEVLDVPAEVMVSQYASPHTVVPITDFPDQSIILPTLFRPRFTTPETVMFSAVSFIGHVANDGLGALMAAPMGELGHKLQELPKLEQSTVIPNFPSILPASFEDATGSLTPVPDDFGARRTSFEIYPALGVYGLALMAADHDRVLLELTFYESYAAAGLLPSLGRLALPLPAGWITTTEFLAL